jgi:hypothetical protein
MIKQIKNLVADMGLNEFRAWLWVTFAAASSAAAMVLLSGSGAEIFRYWRVFFLSM